MLRQRAAEARARGVDVPRGPGGHFVKPGGDRAGRGQDLLIRRRAGDDNVKKAEATKDGKQAAKKDNAKIII